jgi:hypothetical protein
MSFALVLTPKFKAGFQKLDIPLQERVIDRLDDLAESQNPKELASRLERRAVPTTAFAIDVVDKMPEGRRVYAFMQVYVNQKRRQLRVMSIETLII